MPPSGPANPTPCFKSAHARYAAYAAAACGFAFRSLDGEDGYLFEVADGARKAVFAAGAGSPYAMNDARAASVARDKAFCAEALRNVGLPVVPGRMFFVTKRWADMRGAGREPEDALRFAQTASYPLFCKPITASSGQYAEIVADTEAFAEYIERVSGEHFAILAQPYIRGDEYRVFVLHGRALFSYRKLAPPQGGAANRALGGGAADLREGAPAPLAELALAAAEALGLQLAGVDIFDCSAARDCAELMVIEVNSNPMIATLEDHGRWDLIETIWLANFKAALR